MKIHVNQSAYLPYAIKQATVSGSDAAGKTLKLYDSKGRIAAEYTVSETKFDSNSGEETALIDFSDINAEGSYHFESDNGIFSFEFDISAAPFAALLEDAIKMFYYQRCGCDLKPEYAGEYTHKACHTAKVKYLYGDGREFHCSGGWHDAGDYGRYTTAGAVALAHLLCAYKFAPETFDKKNMTLYIPESENDIPDILNECRYELDWLLKMQDRDGAVHHKCTSMRHTDFVMPEDDPLPFIITPVSSLATADFAAVCALASGLYKDYNRKFSERLADAAKLAGKWLLENPGYLFENPKEVSTGDYSDPCDLDERFWAHAELYKLTKDKAYLELFDKVMKLTGDKDGFIESCGIKNNLQRYTAGLPTTLIGWEDVGGLASLAIMFSDEGVFDEALKDSLKALWLDEADRLKNIADSNNFSLAMKPEDFVWGSNLTVLNNAVIFMTADRLKENSGYRDAAIRQLDYILGSNILDISYVTGYGSNPFKNPHNRPTFADGIEEPIPGYVSGGPNYMRLDDAARKNIPEGSPSMKCYTDDVWSYSTNEITIYWNSPLVLLLALLL